MRKEKGKGCCKLNKVVLSLASLIMLIALALNSYAGMTCGYQTPANSGYLTNSNILNVSFEPNPLDATNGEPNIRVAFILTSSATANSSASSGLIKNQSNNTGVMGNLAVNITLGSPSGTNNTILEEGIYVADCVCYNSTNAVSCNSTRTGIVVDRSGVPSVPITIQPTGRQTSRTQTIQTVVIGANTTGCTLTFAGSNPGSVQYAMTHSGNNCSQSFSNLGATTFRYTIRASDGTNSSAETAENTFYVDIAGTTGARKYIVATSGGRTLPAQASATTQQRAFGQQAEDTLNKVIAKAPVNAQTGLTKAKEAVTSQYKGKEAFKTWTGTGVGCGLGALGLVVPPIAIVSIPVGCILGHLSGMIV